MKRVMLFALVAMGTAFCACTNQKTENLPPHDLDTTAIKTVSDMKCFVSIFEIPATDLSRAVSFYEEILTIKIERMEMPEMQLGIFPYEEQLVTGVIIKAAGYQPSADGVTLYLNGGENLQLILDKVEKKEGKILVPKTPHADGSGYFAIFLDSEGNKMGLHSPK